MASKNKLFDLETFLSSVDGGRTISKYRKDETVFAQGDPANAVFYIREGECKVTVVSKQGKEAVVAIHGKGDFFGGRLPERSHATPCDGQGNHGKRNHAA
jgi:CRP/FNR family transcriptional regulator, cyclic AMP receptor protein